MTAQEYIAAAVARSYLNRGEVLAQDVTEMLVRLSQQFRHYYAIGAGLDSSVFAQVAVLPLSTGPVRWVIPSDCDTVHAIEQGTTEVFVVPYADRRNAEPSETCVYRLGNAFYPVGNATDPTQTALTILYTPIPADFTTLADVPPTSWNTGYDQMVIAELALWLANKDGRADEVQALTAELDDPQVGWRSLFTEWLGRKTVPLIRRFGIPQAVPSEATIGAGVRKN